MKEGENDMISKLTPYEKETIILTSEGDDEFSFETFNTTYKRRLAEFCEKYPAYCRLKYVQPEGAVRYYIKKECLSIHLNAPYTDERRWKAREQARKNGLVGQNQTDAAKSA